MQTRLFIDGEFVDALEGATMEVLDPHDCSVIARVAEARAADVDRAVQAAAAAFPAWSATLSADRGRLLLRLADLIERERDDLAGLESRNTGHPLRDSRLLDIPRTASTFRYFGGMADKVLGSVVPVEIGYLNYVLRDPIGVVGQIIPWNFPAMFCSWKLGPALAAGNTVVLKPSELTPLSALRLAELIAEAGFPDGVVNIVPGTGPIAGQRLAEHPDVAKIVFTGSAAVGRRVVEAAAGNVKRIMLELGGKGANVVFADADLDQACQGSAFAAFHNQGQACIAGTRLLLQEDIAEQFLDAFVELARSIRVGHPFDPATEMGPLTSPMHRDRVMSYMKVAVDEGGEILTGGHPPDDPDLAAGCYFLPTVIRADPGARISREEVFGPVVTVTTFRDEAEAAALANDSEYGLGSGVWTSDLARAHRMAQAFRTGMVWINAYKRVNPGSPFGGIGRSGYGRELGFEAMHEYTDPKSVWVNYDAELPVWYERQPPD